MRRRVPLLVTVLMLAVISRTNAQSSTGSFTRHELFLAGAFALGTVAVAPFDELWGNRMQAPRLQEHAGLGATAKRARALGNPGAIVLTAALYAGGGAHHNGVCRSVRPDARVVRYAPAHGVACGARTLWWRDCGGTLAHVRQQALGE